MMGVEVQLVVEDEWKTNFCGQTLDHIPNFEQGGQLKVSDRSEHYKFIHVYATSRDTVYKHVRVSLSAFLSSANYLEYVP
jgi:hypothetical protein